MTNLEKIINAPVWDVLMEYSPKTYAHDDVCNFIDCDYCPVHGKGKENCKDLMSKWLEQEAEEIVPF